MESFTPFAALAGGALIGLAASLLLLFHGRVAGISGILGETLLGAFRGEEVYRVAFLGGLFAAGLALRFVYPSAFGPSGPTSSVALAFAGVAGLLVGYGTRAGSGCTSGHGVCGVSRLSRRSIAATMTFIGVGAATLFIVRHLIGVGR